jgi:hypothetical protein
MKNHDMVHRVFVSLSLFLGLVCLYLPCFLL